MLCLGSGLEPPWQQPASLFVKEMSPVCPSSSTISMTLAIPPLAGSATATPLHPHSPSASLQTFPEGKTTGTVGALSTPCACGTGNTCGNWSTARQRCHGCHSQHGSPSASPAQHVIVTTCKTSACWERGGLCASKQQGQTTTQHKLPWDT